MLVICMDCGKQLGHKDGNGVSHGLCFKHYRLRMGDLYRKVQAQREEQERTQRLLKFLKDANSYPEIA